MSETIVLIRCTEVDDRAKSLSNQIREVWPNRKVLPVIDGRNLGSKGKSKQNLSVDSLVWDQSFIQEFGSGEVPGRV